MDLEAISQETIEAVKKAQTAGITSGTNVTGIDLAGLVSLVPVVTPFRNMLARVPGPIGAKFAQWKALLNVNSSQPDISIAFDYAGNEVQIDEQDISAMYEPIALAGIVTQDAVDLAKGYADAKAITAVQVLNQLMIGEEKKLTVGGTAYALPAIGTVALVNAATGGSIPATTAVPVKCAARSGRNYFYGGSGIASASTSITSGSGTTNSVSAFVPAVKGAVAYDWYVNNIYYTTTTTNTCTITAIPTVTSALPSLPDLSTVVPTTPPTVDTSYGANDFNSCLATILGDYGSAVSGITGQVTPGTGTTPSGAYWGSMDGAPFSLNGAAVTQLDVLNLAIYNSVRLSPTAYMMSSQDISYLSTLVLGTNSAVTFLQPDDPTGRANMVAGGYVGTYLNKAMGGARIKIECHPEMPPGTMIARTDQVPFPGSNIDNVFEVRTLRDYAEFPYAANRVPNTANGGPRAEFEIRSIETLVNRAPVACGVLQNMGNPL